MILKAVKKTDTREDDLDIDVMTEEMAEEIGGNEQSGGGNNNDDGNDDAIPAEQAREGEEIDGSVFVRVGCRCHVTHVSTACRNCVTARLITVASFAQLPSLHAPPPSAWKLMNNASSKQARHSDRRAGLAQLPLCLFLCSYSTSLRDGTLLSICSNEPTDTARCID